MWTIIHSETDFNGDADGGKVLGRDLRAREWIEEKLCYQLGFMELNFETGTKWCLSSLPGFCNFLEKLPDHHFMISQQIAFI